MTGFRSIPCLTPHGRLALVSMDESFEMEDASIQGIEEAFAVGSGEALLRLGAVEVGKALPPVFAYWREFGARHVAAQCLRSDPGSKRGDVPPPPAKELQDLAAAAPAMPGAEYLTAEVLRALWGELGRAFDAGLAGSGLTLQDFLKRLNPAWNVVGRVHFNLAENRADADAPFAFLATYSDRLSAHGKAQHLPLGRALRAYAGAKDKDLLLSLLLPVQRAAERLPWLQGMIAAGELFHPLRWSPRDAFRLLEDAAALEESGVVVRMPATWRSGRPSRPTVTATVGGKAPSGLGKDALLDFNASVTLDDEALTPSEVKKLLAGTEGLHLLRGQWVEIAPEQLARTMERFKQAEQLAKRGGLGFAEAMRLLAGADIADAEGDERADGDWSSVVAGPWLAQTLKGLRSPQGLAAMDPGRDLRGSLRPYQEVGVRWLNLLTRLGLGACLADDMGLGKTIQMLALLLAQRREGGEGQGPSILVVPASLLTNWASEIEKFAPGLAVMVAHPSAMPGPDLRAFRPEKAAGLDLVLTSYGTLPRVPWMAETPWRLAVLDEAQAIKNPATKQTKAVKRLQARARIILTGTPIENSLGDLWSLFDFILPGLLGTAGQFNGYVKRLAAKPRNPYGPLRDLVRPYILRRLKTDKSVIADLPDKNEVKAYCPLSRRQAALYTQAVKEFAARLKEAKGIQRKGLVLSYLTRFKQICNHPSQWIGDGAWTASESGKWARLRELAETIAAKQEKVLIFSQFREVTGPLAAFLEGIFGRPGLVLHGGTPLKRRKDLVAKFQGDESAPFFVLSLKAGGSGLNLTAASHVVHFDRWWNPAVEDQATDRAFRIGQTKNVMVHKFICRGTVEEKIDAMIESKKGLSRELLEGGAEINLTEMGDEDLLQLVALNLESASME